jgi:hypothetical protein
VERSISFRGYAGRSGAGIVDQNVEAAELFDDFRDQPLDPGCVGLVGLERRGTDPLPFQVAHDRRLSRLTPSS